MKNSTAVFFKSVTVMTVVSLLIAVVISYTFYQATLVEKKEYLHEVVHTKADLITRSQTLLRENSQSTSTAEQRIESVFGNRSTYSPADTERGKVTYDFDHHKHFVQFLLVKQAGDQVHFLEDSGEPVPSAPLSSLKEKPPGKVLAGHSGVEVVVSHMDGVRYLVAYQPISGSDLGLVAKVSLERVWDYYWSTFLRIFPVVIGLILIGGWLVRRHVIPFVEKLAQQKSHLEQMNSELHRLDEQLKGFANTASDWFWEMDSDLHFSYFSSQIKRVTGMEPADLIGKRRDEITLHGVSDQKMADHIALLKRHESFRDFVYAVFHRGSEIWVSINGDPLFDRSGKFEGYRGTGREITTLIEREREIELARQAQERAKDEFFASMSHELRTPLTAIIGNSQYLQGQECPPEMLSILHDIETAGHAQLALVNDILDMSKIEAGKFTIDETPYNLSAMLSSVESMLSVRAKDTGNQLRVVLQSEQKTYLLGDEKRIAQILINFLSNATKFTSEGEITLTVWNDSSRLFFEVKDSGIGMSREMMTRLFKPFEQEDSSISKRFGGTGLGLYISYSLAEMMGGKITVDSVEGSGSTFTLQLPYVVTSREIEEERTGSSFAVTSAKLIGSVLLAEDTLVLQQLERRILESMGVTVAVANNGQEAVEVAQKGTFDLILMDMQMPEVDGIEATRILRQQGNTVPIVPLTANVMQKHRDRFAALGCEDFIGKPIDNQELKAVLQKYLVDRAVRSIPEEIDDDLMEIFFNSMERNREKILMAIEALDWSEIRDLSHSIKGSAASFGFEKLSKSAEALQVAMDEERIDIASELAKVLLGELERVL